MQEITLDFTNCKYLLDLHKELKEKFGFPDYYGENLSALWDCLDNYCNWNLIVYVRGIYELTKEWNEYIDKILRIFNDVHNSTPNISFKVIS